MLQRDLNNVVRRVLVRARIKMILDVNFVRFGDEDGGGRDAYHRCLLVIGILLIVMLNVREMRN